MSHTAREKCEAAPWGMMPAFMERLVGGDVAYRAAVKTRLVQLLIVINIGVGTQYIVWRATRSVNWELWLFGLALLMAEMYSYVDSLLFGLNMWNIRERGEPPAPARNLTVDVFVTTYNEPVDLVQRTVRAARDIHYPHKTWVLDDGDRPEMRRAAEALGVGYITRDPAWDDKARHAKAGNVINAMTRTQGEFILILDADQVPRPQILDRTLGYFRDDRVAFVQTPQCFENTPEGDPFGTDAPLFYGPIQAGKDGWNSAFFCGSNAVLRREALMQAGIMWYARDLEERVRRTLRETGVRLRHARRSPTVRTNPRLKEAVQELLGVSRQARRAMLQGAALQEVTWEFQRGVEAISRELVADDLRAIHSDLMALPELDVDLDDLAPARAVREMTTRERSPLAALPEVREILVDLDVDRHAEAEPVMPMSTISVTEDMATAMRLHSLGWSSVYHHEVLAVGLAPDDLRSALQQRLRWAQGTLQVFWRENPMFQSGLTLPQRLLYLATMWSYFSGFASIIYIVSPMLFLVFGLMPIKAYSSEFFMRLVPWLVVNQLLFTLIGWGIPTRRGQQYSLALFPVWIKAVATSISNVFFGRKLGFVVTPKTRQSGIHPVLVWPQLLCIGLLIVSMVIGFVRLGLGYTPDTGPILFNAFWACYCLAMLSVVLEAVSYDAAAD